MADQAKNILIGLFVVAAISIIVFILLFLHPTVGNEEKLLRVRFANIDKITVGTRVTFAGKPVGEVAAIHDLDESYEHRHIKNGLVYMYELELRVDSGINVYNSDEIASRTSGLLGEKSVAIIPLPPLKDVPFRNVDHEILYATETGTVEDTLKDIKVISKKIEKALDQISGVVEDFHDEKVVKKLANTLQNVEDITKALNQPEKLSQAVSNVHQLTVDALASWKKVDHSIDNFGHITNTGKILFTDIKEGKGSVGKILVSDDLYLQLKSLISKGSTIMDDINHYGILFQLDKGWQRLRARRMNLLTRLSSPQQFRNYFNDEVDQISTSLSRVYMVLDKAESEYCYPLINQMEFDKVYADLLRRISEIEESLQMYNQQLVDTRVKETELVDECYN